MADIGSLSDEQLRALHEGDFSKLSDTDLRAMHAAVTPDPVSVNNVGRSFATGVPIIGGLLNKADAATNAALAPALNRFFDPKDQLAGDTFGERYDNSLRQQDGSDSKFAAQHPIIDTGAKLAGGVASMAPVVAAAPGIFGATGGFAARTGAGAVSNAALGGADAAVRGNDPISGALVGGLIGGATPAAEAAASPFISSIMARINPQRFAEGQVARVVHESGMTPAQIDGAVGDAAAEGQSQFTRADALGNAGQRLLSTVARAPGEGRTDVVNALQQRQAGQGRRISNALAEGFNAPETAAATEARLTTARGAQADTDFNAVRADAGPVDLSGALAHIDQTLSPGVHGRVGSSNIANDSVESALQGVRDRITDGRSMLSDFTATQRMRGDLSDTIQRAVRAGEGNKARLLGGVLRQVDAAMENASAGHLAANRNFAQASRDIEAVQTGRDSYNRGRTENTIPAFQSLRPEAQAAFRSGYVDPAIAQTQGASIGRNKAIPFTTDAFRDEAAVMAPGNDLMMRRIGRENTMAETRNQALGGSRTADNLADHEAMGINPSTVMHVATGHWTAAIGSMLHAGVRGLTGSTPAVRKAVADILLAHGARLNGSALDAMVTRTISQLQFIQQLARSGAGAAAVTTNANQPKKRIPIFAPRS